VRGSDWTFFRRLLITTAVVAVAYVGWSVAGLFILLFAAVLLAVLLTGVSELVSRYTRVPSRWTLPLTAVVIAASLIGFFVFFGTQVAAQVADVFSRLPDALDAAGRRFGIDNTSDRLERTLSENAGGHLLSRAASIGYTVIGFVADLVLVLVTGIYLAADPGLYRRGVAKMFPKRQHREVIEALDATAIALRLWFGGQLVAMLLVGVLSATAYLLIGLPSALGLAIIAGLTNFIPMLGPVIGAVPALLFAFTQGPTAVLWTLAAIVAIQQLEGNLITPLVQRRAVDIPPAVILFAIAGFGVLAGPLGVVFAVPLTVVLMVLIQKLWIGEVLGQPTRLPGED
jgi:predicted PurR-regulated permease PerM